MSHPTELDDFVDVADADEFWDGEMDAFDVGDHEVLVVKLPEGFVAYNGICPHQSVSLVEGRLEEGVLTCRAHEWQFDIRTGAGVNPKNEYLQRFPVRVHDGSVLIGSQPLDAEDQPTSQGED